MTKAAFNSGYVYKDAKLNPSHSYLLPVVKDELMGLESRVVNTGKRLFDLGCGNGSVAAEMAAVGWKVDGVDPSTQAIAEANVAYPDLNLQQGSAYDDLVQSFGRFPVVLSLEVVEHVYAPRSYAKTLFDLVEPGGAAIVSTPYHGYLKNLAIAATGKMDSHFTALWDHGHIKFWSIRTLSDLLREAGFDRIRFSRVGRIPPLAKSMLAIAHKPSR